MINELIGDFSQFLLATSSQTQWTRMSDSDKDRPLIDALIADEKLEHPRRRFACTGRFLTMHKRRRKKLTTRSLIQDTAILDDIHHGQVQCILNQVGNWKFNAFTLETVTGGNLIYTMNYLFCMFIYHSSMLHLIYYIYITD